MAKFKITRTEKGLPGTSGSVRDTADPAIGAGVKGRAVAGLGREIVQFDRREKAIEAARQKMTDGNLSVQADAMRSTSDAKYETFKLNNSQDKWKEFRDRQTSDLEGQIGGLKGMSPSEQTRQQAISQRYSAVESSRALTDSTLQLRKDTKIAQTISITNAFRSGDEDQIEEAVARYISLGTVMGKGKEEVQADIEAAQQAGAKLRADDAANDVYAAIELATETGGDYTAAKELAKNETIPEDKQATLRSAISTAESAQEARNKEDARVIKETATSTAIRDSYQGNLTVASLDSQHEKGLIADGVYTKLRDGLAAEIPSISDRVARSLVNREITNFKRGAATKAETGAVFAEQYDKLDEPDRNKFADLIETVYNTGVENSSHEAKTRGSALISKKFKGLLDAISLGNKEARQFDLEWELRNLYEDSIDDWITQQVQKGTDPTPRQIRIMSNDLLIDFKKIKANENEKLAGSIKSIRSSLEQGKILGTEPLKKQRKASEMTVEEAKRERDKLLRLRSK